MIDLVCDVVNKDISVSLLLRFASVLCPLNSHVLKLTTVITPHISLAQTHTVRRPLSEQYLQEREADTQGDRREQKRDYIVRMSVCM